MEGKRHTPAWLLALGGLLALAAFLSALTEMRDTDAFHHLALGREIVRQGAIPTRDPFLYPLFGLDVGRMPYWLSTLLFFGAQSVLGDPGPVVLAALMTAILFVVLWVDSTRETKDLKDALIALIPLALALGACRARAVPRPEIFANAFIALTALGLRNYAEGRRRLLYSFPVLAAVWANLHSSALTGVGLVGLFCVAGLTSVKAGPQALTRAQLLRVGALGVAGLVSAGVLSVRGFDSLVTSVKFVLSAAGLSNQELHGVLGDPLPFLKHQITELQPLAVTEWLGPFGALAAVAVASLGLGWRRVAGWEVLGATLLVVLASRNARYLPLAAVVMAPVTARNLVAFRARFAPTSSWSWAAWPSVGLAAAMAITLDAFRRDDLHFGTGLARKAVPVAAAEYLARNAPGARVFNTFQLGGYLEWALDRPVFQDGRAMLLAPDLEAAFADPINAPLFKSLDDRYHFDALVLAYVTGIDPATAAALDATAGARDWLADRSVWALVAFDDGGLLYLRRDGPFAALAARDEYLAARPGNPFSRAHLRDGAQRAAFIADYVRALEQSPSCSKCRFHLGMALIGDGQGARAEALLAEALPRAHGRYAAELLYGMGLAADLEGDPVRARAHLDQALRTEPTMTNARRALASLELAAGNPQAAANLLETNLAGQATREDFALAAVARRALGDAEGADALAARLANADVRAQGEQRYLDGLRAMQAGHLEEAGNAFRASLELVEYSAPAHSNLGWVYFDQGQPDRALSEFRRAVEVDPGLPESHFGLGLVLLKRDDRAGAAASFRSFLRLQPRGPWALQAEEHLRRLAQ